MGTKIIKMLWEIALCAIIIYLIKHFFFSNVNPSMDKLPGPPRKFLLGSALEFVGYTQTEMFEKIIEFPKLYGNRIGVKVFNRYILHVYTPKDIEVVLSHSRNITKNITYEFMKPWLGTGLLLSTGAKWHNRRKILTPAFHFEILKNFAKVFEEDSRNMVNDINSRLKRGADVLDVMPFLSDYTLYTICETAMGTKLGSGDTQAKLDYKKSTLSIGSLIMQRLPRFWLHSDFTFYLSSLGKEFKKCLKDNFAFTDSVIEERRQQKAYITKELKETDGKKRLALLDLLLEAEGKGEMDLEGIREEVNTFMFEGHDTTAMALTFGLMLLAEHRKVQDLIYEECISIFGHSDRTATTAELAEMKYLEATIKEILRLYPSVPFIGRLITEDFYLDETHVTKGTEVVVHIYDVHRNEEYFPEPELFRPERFLMNGDKTHFSYIPFSAGPRNCIGQRFAMQEMKYMLSDIIRHFILSPEKMGFRPKLKTDLVLRSSEPIYVKFSSR
ncbi:cytochrome P450 4C1-like isoform X2 [Pieris brassicae]|uniref:cytochrome P450 4C1-like isoform X2 n=1 Tax=Pieris brassicae TaxID=7116 RepID=UPI001E6616BA|nr:cytochrome P450 4C1-like isoform X2 [Pieris brassicae]